MSWPKRIAYIVKNHFFESYVLDHKLNFETNRLFTKEIDIEIQKFQAKMSSNDLTSYINETFGTKFEVYQIKYRVERSLEAIFGRPDEDAFIFVKLAQNDVNSGNGGFFAIETGENNCFLKALYISSVMLTYTNFFLDIVIIDTTYKRNRFSLPLVNVIGINNIGQNILMAFGFLNDETALSYDWFFKNLRMAWKRDPQNIITDDCSELQQGKFFHYF